MVFIYALCEPGTRTVRYLGKTVNPARRGKEHVRVSSRYKSHLGSWLRSLISREVLPDLIVLREVPESQGSAAEIKYIRIARESLGMRLVNETEGGEGNPKPSEETRARMSRSQKIRPPRSLETRAKLSAARKGNKHPLFGKEVTAETRERISKGVRSAQTPEYLAKLRRAALGRPQSEETRAKHRDSLKGRPKSLEHRLALRAGWARRRKNLSQQNKPL